MPQGFGKERYLPCALKEFLCFVLFFFLWLHLQHMEIPWGQGSNQSYTRWPTSQHGSTRSELHLRPMQREILIALSKAGD